MPLNVEVATGRCRRFIGIGGNPVHPGMLDRHSTRPTGMRLLAAESDPPVGAAPAQEPAGAGPPGPAPDPARQRFAAKVAAAERSVLDAHARGAFTASYIRYPIIYGPRTWLAYERGVVRRLLDGRRRMLLPDGGLSVFSRCADKNAAALVGLVVDRADVAAGQVYSVADDEQYSLQQWTELLAEAAGSDLELVGVPLSLARPVWDLLPTGPAGSPHTLAELVTFLVDDPTLVEVHYDPAAEDAVLDEMDRVHQRLSARLGWASSDATAGFRQWHAYDHPADPPA
jgi:nucleoside-diphosphate-sugar epimerase